MDRIKHLNNPKEQMQVELNGQWYDVRFLKCNDETDEGKIWCPGVDCNGDIDCYNCPLHIEDGTPTEELKTRVINKESDK